MNQSDYVTHVLGRIYLCANGHETDDVEIGDTAVEQFIDAPLDAKPCTTCGEIATVKFYGDRHLKTEPCTACQPEPPKAPSSGDAL